MGRVLLLMLAVSGAAWSQAMVEGAALAAGSAVGSVAGKGVSASLTKVMDKATKPLEASARGRVEVPPPPPLLVVGPAAVVSKPKPYNVPPPPASHPRTEAKKPVPVTVAVAPEPPQAPLIDVTPVFMQPLERPKMSAEELAALVPGMRVEQVLKLGRNAVRVSRTIEGGHSEEILRYRDGYIPLGVVRVLDGRVTSIEIEQP